MSPATHSTLFAARDGWQVIASGQATGALTEVSGPAGRPALRLEFDFGPGAGFVVLRKVVDWQLPEVFTAAFSLRGAGPHNHFEVKVADPGGANVWRHLQAEFPLPEAWSPFSLTERGLPFAWGPAGGGAPGAVGAVEFAIVAGPGGKGWVEFADFSLTDETPATAVTTASSHLADAPPAAVLAGHMWKAAPDDAKPWWQADFGRLQRFGGLTLDWPDDLPPRAFRLEVSRDGRKWRTLHRASSASGPRTWLATPNEDARFLRLRFANAGCAALRGVTLKPDAFSHTPNEFLHAVAAGHPRGWHPRYWHREQSYWTPVGNPEGRRRGLLNEEGLLETDEAGFSLEPFVLLDGRLVTWAEADCSPTLPADGSPLPGVVWRFGPGALHIEPWIDGSGDTLVLRAAYRIEWDGLPPADLRLALAARPFQVNPPWQAFRNLGGMSPIHEVACHASHMTVAGKRVTFHRRPAASGAAAFEEGGVMPFLAAGGVPPRAKVRDGSGLASACALWSVAPGETVVVSVPFFNRAAPLRQPSPAAALKRWQRTLDTVTWSAPPAAAAAIACFRTAAGHILINRDGPAIQPGPRRYTRSWVRDCVIMGAALAKAGLPHALREFLTWYAPFQRDDGFVPAVVDRDGIDWIVEHDSHGQLLWGLREMFRAAPDPAALAPFIPVIRGAADFIIRLRHTRMTPEFLTEDRLECHGLLPESASHEGYLAHPVHSYWDDFWGIRGLEAAADLAAALGDSADASRWRYEAAAFLTDVGNSLDHLIARRNLTYIPGSVEWADFDPTATANAIALLDFADDLPAAPLRQMLATYLDGFRRKHSGAMPWTNYTAYEIRIIGAFTRLGLRDEAHELLERFLIDRRPAAWNQWPEITWHDARSPGHLGDVPHTWIAAEYLLAFAALAVAEREVKNSLVLAGGLPWAWIEGTAGFHVKGLPTRFGAVSFALSAPHDHTLKFALSGPCAMPPGGVSLVPPLPSGTRIAALRMTTGAAEIAEDGLTLRLAIVPAKGTITLTRPPLA